MDEGTKLYLDNINKVPDLSEAEEQKLALLASQNEDTDATDKLAEANMKHAAKVAIEYWEKGGKKADLLDVIRYGNTGLVRAAYHYTPTTFRFWDYARWWVKSEIQKGLNSTNK